MKHDIYKICHVNNKDKTYIIFVGNNFGEVNLNELYSIDPNDPIFESIFDDTEKYEISKYKVIFISEYISRDDDLSLLKYKIRKAFNFQCHSYEIYLYYEQELNAEIPLFLVLKY